MVETGAGSPPGRATAVPNLDPSERVKPTRTFLAIDLEDDARKVVAAWKAGLAVRLGPRGAVHVKWVEERNLHLTLHFFGGLTDAQIEAVSAALTPAWPMGPFDLRAEGCGVFPPRGTPRVIWAGVSAPDARLAKLHEQVARRLAPVGLSETDVKRPFAPHLTIGRVRPGAPPAWGRDLRLALEPPIERWNSRVDRLTLFASRMSPRGSTYDVLAEFGLSRPGH